MKSSGTFAEWLLAAMKERRLSSAQLAKKAELSEGHISHLLADSRRPGAGALGSLARALDLPLNVLLQKAGYIAATTDQPDELEEEWKGLIDQAETDDEKRELIERARFELNRIRERRAGYKAG